MPTTTVDRRANSERVCVLIDNGSLYTALYQLGLQCRVDYRRLRQWLLGESKPTFVRFYCGEIRNDKGRKKPFYDLLKRFGFDIISLHEPNSQAEHAALDDQLRQKMESLISLDMTNFLNECDRIILVSGSPQLVEAVKVAQEQGVDVEVSFFEEVVDDELASTANGFRSLRMDEFQMRNNKLIKVPT
jgi:hypothetical protein